MLYLPGSKALPHFASERLLTEISFDVPKIYGLVAQYIHFIDLETELTTEENQLLIKLLQYGVKSEDVKPEKTVFPKDNLILIIPQFGTTSSWSNKATDIAHYCGLKSVKRIERGVAYTIQSSEKLTWGDIQSITTHLFDPMMETVIYDIKDAEALFQNKKKEPLYWIDILQEGLSALTHANQKYHLHLKKEELNYLYQHYFELKRNPTDVELMIFTKCRHYEFAQRYFNTQWVIDDDFKPQSLYSMIKNTVQVNPRGISYHGDDANAVFMNHNSFNFFSEPIHNHYQFYSEPLHLAMGTESHLPGILKIPNKGAALALGREIRQESSVGRGAIPKAGFSGYLVQDLNLSDFKQAWNEKPNGKTGIPLAILNISLGATQFANEFGRPNLCGYLRSFSKIFPKDEEFNKNNSNVSEVEIRGYERPLMITGGFSEVREPDILEQKLKPETLIAILGNKSILIGIKSEHIESKSKIDKILPFIPLERIDAEMQRRAQAVINHCIALGEENPILAIQNVAAGGLAKTIPQFLWHRNVGGFFELAKIPVFDQNLSPLEIWCNETEERFLLAFDKSKLDLIQEFSLRENCPLAVIGKIIQEPVLRCFDEENKNFPIDIPLSLLFELPNKRQVSKAVFTQHKNFDPTIIDIKEALFRVLKMPTIADKSFLITLSDRTVTGLVSRDQMVGPWQVPVADCAVTACSFLGYQGQAFALGERPPLALIDADASARMSVGEAITNIAAACIGTISDIRLALNCYSTLDSALECGESYKLFSAIKALGLEFCPAINLAIPVVEGSLLPSNEPIANSQKGMKPPLSMVISAFAPVMDIRRTLTPVLSLQGETDLILIDLGFGRKRLGGSAFAYAYGECGNECPDIEDPTKLKAFFNTIQRFNLEGKILSYHDRSDGGLIITLCEMAFASHTGLHLDVTALGDDPKSILFNEELGVVIQVKSDELEGILLELYDQGLTQCYAIGKINTFDNITILFKEDIIFSEDRLKLQKIWSQNSYYLQSIRDNPRTAKKLYEILDDREDPGLNVHVTFDLNLESTSSFINLKKPAVAILREQGTQGELEMAAAFHAAGFDVVDVHMNDLAQNVDLSSFKGLALCGGFTFGDVLGAGFGLAMRILTQSRLKEIFQAFFQREDTFTFGAGNGCQILAHLKSIIPGAELWPKFIRNTSLQFESRLCLVEIEPSPAILLEGMEGSILPVPVAHGEGHAEFIDEDCQQKALQQHLVTLRFVDNRGRKTKVYPANPNGSPLGVTGLTSEDGRVSIMMPHPERAIRTVQYSWHPQNWGAEAPWLRMFQNARTWVG